MKVKELIALLRVENGDDEVIIGLPDGKFVHPSDVNSDSINVIIEAE